MIYEFTISTPKNTAESAKQKTVLKLEAGMITDLKVWFPLGSTRYLHLQLCKGGHQFLPKSVGDFRGNGVLLDFPSPQIPFYDAPYELDAFTWNTSTRHAHELDIYLEISRPAGFIG